ncbi:hypothetical protein Zmor_009011 [Zophobas morio]|jgi:hypothetical protein|uniref:Uncharacterized protein n=1 Tax=Zophobas morio TaxID=2755281 RepID=A0AA38HK00_9CUCU|nr:hypothetical protein Zmor_009011 [Zophobas morio]
MLCVGLGGEYVASSLLTKGKRRKAGLPGVVFCKYHIFTVVSARKFYLPDWELFPSKYGREFVFKYILVFAKYSAELQQENLKEAEIEKEGLRFQLDNFPWATPTTSSRVIKSKYCERLLGYLK